MIYEELIRMIDSSNYYTHFLTKYTLINEKGFTFYEIFYEGSIDESADPADYTRINTRAVRIA